MRTRPRSIPLLLLVVGILTLATAAPAAATNSPMLSVAISDSALELTTGGTVSVPASGSVNGTIATPLSVSADAVVSPILLTVLDIDGPGGVALEVNGSRVTAPGELGLVDAGAESPISAAFDAPGEYRVTIAATAEVNRTLADAAESPSEQTTATRLTAAPVVLEFYVASAAETLPDTATGEEHGEADAATPVDGRSPAPAFPTRSADTGARPIALTKGHIDLFEVTYDAELGGLRLSTKDDTNLYEMGPTYRNPADLTVFVDSDLAALDVSGMPAVYDFLKVDGDLVSLLPQTQDLELPWPGWSTERLVGSLPAGVALSPSGSPVELAVDIDGPGNVFGWQAGSFGGVQNKFIDTVDPAPDVIPIPRSAHVHTNWAFTLPGDYYLTVTPTATTTSGGTLTGPGVVYRIHVGPASDAAPSASSEPAIEGTGNPGEALELDPGQWLPTPHQVDTQWLRDGIPIPAATGLSYTPTADDAGHSVSVRVTATVGTVTSDADAPAIRITPQPGDEERWDVPNGTPTESGATILNAGHIDIASLLEDGRLVTRIKDTSESSEPTWREPEQTVLQALPTSAIEVPEIPEFAFLGEPGDTVWLLPQIQDPGLLWPGWSTEQIPGDATQTPIEWTLTDAEGPGEFALFEENAVGMPTVFFNTGDDVPDAMSIAKNVHAHGSWAFGAEGVYCLGFTRSATLANGSPATDDFVVTVAVGDVDVAKVDPAECFEVDEPEEPSEPPVPGDPDPQQPSASASQCVAGSTILSAGHIDFATRLVGGRVQSLVGDDTGSSKVYREPSGVVLWLKPSSAVTLPSGVPQVGPAGSTVWQVPQTQDSNLIWLGWSTEALNAGNAAGPVTWKLNSVSGPGSVKVYTTGSFGNVSMVLNGPSSYSIPLGVHAHANWSFSAQGAYRLNFTQTVTLANGQRSADTETLTIAVGNVDPAAVGSGSGCGVVSSALLDSSDPQSTTLAAGPGTAADERRSGDSFTRSDGGGSGTVDPITALNQGNPVPLLLLILGVVLLAGAVGAGVLWWRRARVIDAGLAP